MTIPAPAPAEPAAGTLFGEPNFEGHQPRECGEHRTVGPVRAWCFECSEWCYPAEGCKGCRAGTPRRDAHGFAEFTCGLCGEVFTTNCDLTDIACVECEARRCPDCGWWFGSQS